MTSDLKTDLFLKIYDRLNEPMHREARGFVYRFWRNEYSRTKRLDMFENDEFKKNAEIVLADFEQVGILIEESEESITKNEKNTIKEIILKSYSNAIVNSWESLDIFINIQRHRRNDISYAQYFETLYEKAKDFRTEHQLTSIQNLRIANEAKYIRVCCNCASDNSEPLDVFSAIESKFDHIKSQNELGCIEEHVYLSEQKEYDQRDFDIIVQGIYTKFDISVNYTSEPIRRGKNELNFINNEWTEQKQKRGLKASIGILVGADDYIATNAEIKLKVRRTDYKSFVGTRTKKYIDEFCIERIANPLSAGAILLTQDDKILLGIRGEGTDSQHGTTTVVAGYVDMNDVKENKAYVFDSIQREIEEELFIPKERVFDLICMGMINNLTAHQINLPFFGRVSMTSSEFQSQLTNYEFDELRFEENTESNIRRILEDPNENLSDIGRPSLEMYANLFNYLNLGEL